MIHQKAALKVKERWIAASYVVGCYYVSGAVCDREYFPAADYRVLSDDAVFSYQTNSNYGIAQVVPCDVVVVSENCDCLLGVCYGIVCDGVFVPGSVQPTSQP